WQMGHQLQWQREQLGARSAFHCKLRIDVGDDDCLLVFAKTAALDGLGWAENARHRPVVWPLSRHSRQWLRVVPPSVMADEAAASRTKGWIHRIAEYCGEAGREKSRLPQNRIV